MALHKIVYYPDPILSTPAATVDTFDAALKTLIEDMFETMYEAKGCGLAAPQIGISKRIAVIDSTPDKTERLVLINPEVVEKKELVTMEEGCLSVPGSWDKIKRYRRCTLNAQDENGKPYELEAEGLLAEAIQHETDHLNGILYIDHLSNLKRVRAKKKLDKFKKANGIN